MNVKVKVTIATLDNEVLEVLEVTGLQRHDDEVALAKAIKQTLEDTPALDDVEDRA